MNKFLIRFGTIFFITFLLLSFFSVSSHAESIPRGVAADNRVKIVSYDPNNVVLLKGKYGYQTQIVFGSDESVQSVSIGDSMAWQAVPVGNNLFIKPITASVTNMTILTNDNSYSFKLDSSNPTASPTYKLQFIYPTGGFDASGRSNAVSTLKPSELNWKYSFTGSRSIAPIEAFDNNEFTFFKFKKNGMSHIPAIFIVDKNQNETLVNYHVEGDYVVVNSVSKEFTLRNGAYVSSIYNDKAIGDWKKVAV